MLIFNIQFKAWHITCVIISVVELQILSSNGQNFARLSNKLEIQNIKNKLVILWTTNNNNEHEGALDIYLKRCKTQGRIEQFFEGGGVDFFLYGRENLWGVEIFLKNP